MRLHSVLLQTFHRRNWIWKVNGGWNFGNILPINVPKCYTGKVQIFWHETFKFDKVVLSRMWSLPFHYRYRSHYEHYHSRKAQPQRKLYHCRCVWKKSKSWDLPCKWRIWSCILYYGPGAHFLKQVGNESGVMLRGKGPHKPEFIYDSFSRHSLMINRDLIEYDIVDDTNAPLLRSFLLVSKLRPGENITKGKYIKNQTFSNLQLQFRLLLKKSFHSLQIDLRDKSGEKKPFVSVGITRFVLIFRKTSNILF